MSWRKSLGSAVLMLLVFGFVALWTVPVQADPLYAETSACLAGPGGPTCFRPNVVISGNAASGNPAVIDGSTFPWLAVKVMDTTTDNAVLVQMRADLENPAHFFSNVYMNLADSLVGKTFTAVANPNPVPTSDTVTPGAVEFGNNDYKADGDGFFDIRFNFATSGTEKFEGTEYVTYLITCTNCTGTDAGGNEQLTETSLNFFSTGGDKGAFRIAAHLQGLATSTNCVGGAESCSSVWIGGQGTGGDVPEPATLVLATATMGFGGAIWKGIRRRRA